MKLPLRYYGDPVLRKKAEPIEEITDEIRQLSHDMIETMLEHNGIGLAAPQVGKPIRLFVSNMEYEDEEGEIHLGEPRVFINPVLSKPSEAIVERSEGCLSIPNLHLPIIRPVTITIEALDLEGNAFSKECYGYLGRCYMHETDHLDGILFIDHVKGKRRDMIEPVLRQVKQKYYLS